MIRKSIAVAVAAALLVSTSAFAAKPKKKKSKSGKASAAATVKTTAAETAGGAAKATEESAGAKPQQAKEVTTPSGLKYIDLKSGTGTEAASGKQVVVHYTGWLENGKEFDSSRTRAVPFSFPLGAGQVIKGWDEGVAGMKTGGLRKLIIPSGLGYGERGAGNVIPPNSTLIFEVELLEVK
ncbi:MAG: FKBP-type peptidyl-prolyl cis-trans isomerase [Candidatus Wallbacteria bacterium]|nr:FKBP-type peptidyl-prolyl cis-trans isomerase [Candidatus Wallbacteria bacterium]